MHSINTGDGECESSSGDYSYSASGNLCGTADSNADCKRSDNIFMDSINSAERDNGFSYNS